MTVLHIHMHTSLHNHKQLWNKYLEFRNSIEKDGNLFWNYWQSNCLDVLSPGSVPSYLTTAGVEGLKPSLGYWTPWRIRSQEGIFIRILYVNNLTELEMVASISTQRGESHSESFLQKRSGEILWIMYELYDCTPSKNKS